MQFSECRKGRTMSKETHPNINAAGLVPALFTAINIHVRGKAKQAGRTEVVMLVADVVARFAVEISVMLDEKFGVK